MRNATDAKKSQTYENYIFWERSAQTLASRLELSLSTKQSDGNRMHCNVADVCSAGGLKSDLVKLSDALALVAAAVEILDNRASAPPSCDRSAAEPA